MTFWVNRDIRLSTVAELFLFRLEVNQLYFHFIGAALEIYLAQRGRGGTPNTSSHGYLNVLVDVQRLAPPAEEYDHCADNLYCHMNLKQCHR